MIEICLALGFLFTLLLASRWGPAVHVSLASEALDRIRRCPSPEMNGRAEVVLRHPRSFYYGTIAADLINFKRYGGPKNHCHDWSVRDRLEAIAASNEDSAFVQGYLCHLAADIVAHNHFVPFQMLFGMPPLLQGHTYWELRADGTVPEYFWELIDGLRCDGRMRTNDILVHRVVPRRALSLGPNRWIFNNIVLAKSRRSWRLALEALRRQRRAGELHGEFLDACRDRALSYMLAIFESDRLREIEGEDPVGRLALRRGREIRRRLLLKYQSRDEARAASELLASSTFALPCAEPSLQVRGGPPVDV